MIDTNGRPGTVLEGPLHPMLCVTGHPDAVPVRFDHADDLRQEVNEAHVEREEARTDTDVIVHPETGTKMLRPYGRQPRRYA